MQAARIDFGESDDSFSKGLDFDYRHTDWYKLFTEKKAEIFLADRVLSRMGPHQLRDFLVVCRNSLKIGGRLRIGESDANHASHQAQAGTFQSFDIETLTNLLASVGLAPNPVEFRDRVGHLHEFAPDFEHYGRIESSSRLDPSRGLGRESRRGDNNDPFASLIVDGVKISDERTGANGFKDKIFAVGDSHVRFLSGCDEGSYDRHAAGQGVIRFEGYSSKFIGLHVGPGLAFNLNTPNTRNHSREKVEELIGTGALPKGAKVMFSFGEIDCRFHVCRHADRQADAIEAVVDGIADEYAIFLDWVAAQGFSPSVWGIPSVSRLGETSDQQNPVYGSYEQRLMAADRFNARLKDICKTRDMPFLCVLDKVSDESGNPRQDLFFDVLHLSQRARPLLHGLMPYGLLPQ